MLGDAFRVQGRCPKKEMSVVFDAKVRKKKIMMIIHIMVQPIGDWEGGHMTKFNESLRRIIPGIRRVGSIRVGFPS